MHYGQTYGDAIDNDCLDPYAFGLLFDLGFYSLYQQQPDGFQECYDRLLASTLLGGATELPPISASIDANRTSGVTVCRSTNRYRPF